MQFTMMIKIVDISMVSLRILKVRQKSRLQEYQRRRLRYDKQVVNFFTEAITVLPVVHVVVLLNLNRRASEDII